MHASTVRAAHWGALAITLIWLLVASLIYGGWVWYESLERASLVPYQGQGGELVVPRDADDIVGDRDMHQRAEIGTQSFEAVGPELSTHLGRAPNSFGLESPNRR